MSKIVKVYITIVDYTIALPGNLEDWLGFKHGDLVLLERTSGGKMLVSKVD